MKAGAGGEGSEALVNALKCGLVDHFAYDSMPEEGYGRESRIPPPERST